MILSIMTKAAEYYATIKTLIYGIFIALNLPIDSVKVLLYMIAADTLLGIIKTVRLRNEFTFKKLIWGMISKMMLLFFPMIIALAGQGLNYDITAFPNLVIDLIIVSEAYSAIGNIQAIRTGEDVKNIDVISSVFVASRKALKKVIDRILSALGVDDLDN